MRPANLTGGRRTGHGSGQRRRARERNESQREFQTERPRETISFALIQFFIKKYTVIVASGVGVHSAPWIPQFELGAAECAVVLVANEPPWNGICGRPMMERPG